MHGSVRPDIPHSDAYRPSRRRGRALVAGAAVLLVAGGLYLTYGRTSSHGDTLVTEAVTRGDLVDTVTATGKIMPRAYVDVGAQASGQLDRILVRIGDRVKQGQLLAEIDPQVQSAKVDADEAQLAQYDANLAEQEANVDFARASLKRNTRLVEGDAVSQTAFDESRRDAKIAAARADATRAQIRQMRSTLKADQVALGYTKIYAPMAGTVVSIDAREGQTLNAAYSTPQIMRIADLTTMTVWTQVSEADVTRLKVGMPVYFTTLGYGDRRWTARLRQILPAPYKPVQPTSSNANASASTPASNVVLYTALFDIDNGAGDLRPDMTAQVFFVVGEAHNAVIAPMAAIHDDGDDDGKGTVSMVSPGGTGKERSVEIGLHTRFKAEIVSGLEPGDRVVTGVRKDTAGRPLVGFRL